MPTATLEEYLEAIFKLSERGPVRPGQVAEAMCVSAPTVTATLGRLHARGLVERESGAVVLTAEGRSLALDIIRRHRLAERLLVDLLGMDLENVHEDACLLEHALSPRVLEALERVLGAPAVCPHGHPIPALDGTMAPVSGVPLTVADEDTLLRVVQIAEDDEPALRNLQSMGIVPPAEILVERRGADGALLILSAGERYALDTRTAARVLVEVIGKTGI